MKPWQLMLILAAVYDSRDNSNNHIAAITFLIVAVMFFIADLF